MTRLKICICGGGNLAHVTGGFLAARPDCEVRLLTRHPEQWNQDRTIVLTDVNGKCFRSRFAIISSDAAQTVYGSDIVLLCLPGFAIARVLESIKGYIGPETMVGSVVSSTGFFLMADRILPADRKLFGFQRVPFIARTAEYGKSAYLLGYKPSLAFATENVPYPESLGETLSELFDIPAVWLDNPLKATLTNSNPLLHPSRLYGMFRSGRKEYDSEILFYEQWDEFSSETLTGCDSEFCALTEKLGIRKDIPSILEYYESNDSVSLTAKIRSIRAFKGLKAPMVRTASGNYSPDYSSRYFTEDIPFGMLLIKAFAWKNAIPTPMIDKVLEWAQTAMGKSYLLNGKLEGKDLPGTIVKYIL